MKRTVFVLGGTGYVGKEIVKRLIEENFSLVLLVRPGAEKKIPKQVLARIDTIQGDAKDLLTLKEKVGKYKPVAFLYLIGLLKEVPFRNMLYIDYHYNWAKDAIDLAKKLGIKRFLLMSANGASKRGTGYQTTKFMAEEYLKHSELAWTIFRPSVIVGNDPLPHFIHTIKEITRFPLVPIPGEGNYRLAPVSRNDVASAFAKGLTNRKTFGKVYHLCGPKSYTFGELIHMTARVFGRRLLLAPIPLPLVMIVGRLFRNVPSFPFTDELVQMLTKGNTCKESAVWQDLNIQPTPFETVLEEYAPPHVQS